MSTSPHKRWKGCAMCKPQKFKDQGRKERDPISVKRRMGKRNYGRHEIPQGQE